jgi:transcriptional regulator with XRE-family HTH domain
MRENHEGGIKMSNIGNAEIFAKNLKFYLERSGKTQKEVATAIGVTPASFNEWIKAKKYPRIDKIEMLSIYFGVLKSDLIEEKGINKTLPQKQTLTEGEAMLLELFRQVPEHQRDMVLEMIRAALKTK